MRSAVDAYATTAATCERIERGSRRRITSIVPWCARAVASHAAYARANGSGKRDTAAF
jgi:hypothetical protein